MTHLPTQFKLKIQDVEQTALFELSWDGGLPIDARLTIPPQLFDHYQTWRDRYYSFYRTSHIPLKKDVSAASVDNSPGNRLGRSPENSLGRRLENSPENSLRNSLEHTFEGSSEVALRGRKAGGGPLNVAPKDSRKKLVKAELDLIYAFNLWLRSPELYELRERLAQASRDASSSHSDLVIDLFLTFTSSQLVRLPWEAWEIGTEFSPIGNIRIARAPANIHQSPSPPRSSYRRSQSKAQPPRILVILGDDTGLDLTADLDSINSLKRTAKADVRSVGWTGQQSRDELINEITDAIADPLGWDVLFFAGHSQEMKLGGGELAIAPKTTIALKELKPSLVAAQRHGLKFALFNSCSGLDIAATLIDWGLSQVAVMREPIHNQVAQTFLEQFLQGVADHQDVHTALLTATEFFKSKTNIAYPSAHLIPTLFRHPQSTLYHIEKTDWKSRLQRLMPSRREAIALSSLALVSLLPVAQNRLLEQRALVQAQYRQMTGRMVADASPPVVLVLIDGVSLSRDEVEQRRPISQSYMAQLIRQLTRYQPDIIGIDYILDVYQEIGTPDLTEAIEGAMGQGTSFVFGTYRERGQWQKIPHEVVPENLPQRVDGDIEAWPNRVRLPHWKREHQPLAYALAKLRRPQALANGRTERSIPTLLSYLIRQQWFEPIIDFSIPPEQVYEAVSAWTLSDASQQTKLANQLAHLEEQVVLIIPGGYPEAGIDFGEDNKPVHPAMQHWYDQSQSYQGGQDIMTGGELQAYRLHHFLTERLVIPLPDIFFVLLAAGVGKGVVWGWQRSQSQSSPPDKWQWMGWSMAGTVVYTLFSVELYLSPIAILVPIALPTLLFWSYVMPILLKRRPAR